MDRIDQQSVSPLVNSRSWIRDGAASPFAFIEMTNGLAEFRGSRDFFAGTHHTDPADRRPRGLFAHWHWDGSTLIAETDPLGGFTLFVYAESGRLGMSPSILQLIAQGANAATDDMALAVFHRIGFFLECDTPFRFIRALPPGGRLCWCNGELRISGGVPVPQYSKLTRAQAVKAFIEVPRAAITRCLQACTAPIALPLSGGRDSRHILMEMVHQGRPPEACVTFHHGGNDFNGEIQTARALAKRAGVNHLILGHPRFRLRDSLRALLLTQLCADEHGQMLPLHDFLAGQHLAAFDGIGGDILTNPDGMAARFMQLARLGDYRSMAVELAAGHARVISRPRHSGGAGTLYSPTLETDAIDRITDTLRQHANAPDPYQSFWFWNRTRREIAFVSTALMGSAEQVFCPYLDPEMVELGLSLPWEITSDRMLHDEALQRAFPDYIDIPFAGGYSDRVGKSIRLPRASGLADNCRVAMLAEPAHRLHSLYRLLAPGPLWRSHADIYHLHAAFVTDMSRHKAQWLLALGDQLDADSRQGMELVSDAFQLSA